MEIRSLDETDRGWVAELIRDRWGAETVVGHGVVHTPHELPGFVAHERGETLGLATYALAEGGCELVTIDSLVEGRGVGTALLEAVAEAAAPRRLPPCLAGHDERQSPGAPLLPKARIRPHSTAPGRGREVPRPEARDPEVRERRHPDPRRARARARALGALDQPTADEGAAGPAAPFVLRYGLRNEGALRAGRSRDVEVTGDILPRYPVDRSPSSTRT